MKAYVFSIGEKTTELCCELLTEYGFDVILYEDNSTLWAKLKRFYTEALQTEDEFFLRVDADIIPNANVKKLAHESEKYKGWICASGFDWYSQDRKAISIHRMDREQITEALKFIDEAEHEIRPETYLWRRPSINKDTYIEDDYNCGLHGYAQGDHRERIKTLKYNRHQSYDWELLDRIEAL